MVYVSVDRLKSLYFLPFPPSDGWIRTLDRRFGGQVICQVVGSFVNFLTLLNAFDEKYFLYFSNEVS
jgi:hypothetical protein